jgi:hypothetical protein
MGLPFNEDCPHGIAYCRITVKNKCGLMQSLAGRNRRANGGTIPMDADWRQNLRQLYLAK